MRDTDLDSVYVPLKWTFGLVPLLAGLDKFTGVLADWQAYLSPRVADLLPIDAGTLMMAVGVVEAVVGLAILFRFTRLGAFVAMGWLILIAINLAIAGILDVAIRDLVMAVGAYTLGTLARLRGEAWWPARTHKSKEVDSHVATS